VGKIAKKLSERVRFLLIRHLNYSAILPKIHSYRLLLRLFCPQGGVRKEMKQNVITYEVDKQKRNHNKMSSGS